MVTIKDIAEKSGVSKGTVDRVMHNRGGVSKKSYEKVMTVIRELGYEPNMYASLLASKKCFTIVVIMPKFQDGEYWSLVNTGIQSSANDLKSFNTTVESLLYDSCSVESFREACRKALEMKPSGAILAPMFKNDSLIFAETLKREKIPYIYIDTKLEDDGYLAYFGMPMYRSGYLCANLLTGGSKPSAIAMCRVLKDKAGQSDPTISRRAGFIDYILEHFPECSIYNVMIDPTTPQSVDDSLSQFFASHQEVRFIAMFGSRVHLVVQYLEKHGITGCSIVGFDDLEKNIHALRRGSINYIITQRAGDQVSLAIRTLSQYLVFRKPVEQRDNYMHMDILTRYNID